MNDGCNFCNGKGDIDLNKVKADAKEYVKEKQVAVVIYREQQEYKFMEAKAFFKQPEGEPIDCISFV